MESLITNRRRGHLFKLPKAMLGNQASAQSRGVRNVFKLPLVLREMGLRCKTRWVEWVYLAFCAPGGLGNVLKACLGNVLKEPITN